MHKKLLVGVGMIGLAGLLAAPAAFAASQTRSAVHPATQTQLAKDDTQAAPAGEKTHGKKKHKKSKKSKGKGEAAAPSTDK